MPKLDGRETLRRLRHSEDWTPIILPTQINGSPERIMALEEGADDYLNKPFDPQELVVRIRAILRSSQGGTRNSQQAQQTGLVVNSRPRLAVQSRSKKARIRPKRGHGVKKGKRSS